MGADIVAALWVHAGAVALEPRSATATTSGQIQAGRPACHLRAIRGGLWRLLAVTHGHSGHFDLRRLLY
jgi:hypothetical protein